MEKFNEKIATKGSCAQETLADAMCNWWMASNRQDAYQQIQAAPGQDLAGIENSVTAGLRSLADSLGVELKELLLEKKLQVLASATPEMIIKALDAIHIQWIADNFSARRWAEKYFKHQLGQYRKTAKLDWPTVMLDLLFIQRYLCTGGNAVAVEELQQAFAVYSAVNSSDEDLSQIAERARTFSGEIVSWIIAYRDKLDPEKKAEQINEINDFLAHQKDGAEIMEIMISAVVTG